MARTLALLALCMALGRRGVFASPSEKLAHVFQYERVTPHRVPAAPGKRDLSAQLNTYPDHVHYSIRAEGRDYVLRLEKNKGLIGEHYTETYYSENGTEITERPDTQQLCKCPDWRDQGSSHPMPHRPAPHACCSCTPALWSSR